MLKGDRVSMIGAEMYHSVGLVSIMIGLESRLE